MELGAKYNPHDIEKKWYEYWEKNELFSSKPNNKEPYTIVIPPPNVTGVLHMGHMLNNTIQDVLVRKARLSGKNACWVPGTDHASIATEAKVVNRLAEQGIKKRDLTREQFLKYAWAWTDEHGGIILKQLRRLGASCDWERTAFTMDEQRSESVMKVFVDLYKKGLIYRGLRMVNWDPKAQTVLSTEEVIYRDEKSKLFYLRYYVADTDVNPVKLTNQEGEVVHQDENGKYYAVVATTRPETIMGDTAMCINPKDPKNRWLSGHKVTVPLVNRVIPVIEDRYVDIEFGTGCLKVTPAHDVNDYTLGKTHNLETIDIFNPDGTLSEAAGLYVGQDRMDVRKQIAIDLKNANLLEKVENYNNKVGYSERNQDTAVEPRLCKQWFLSMKHFAEIALPPVLDGKKRSCSTHASTKQRTRAQVNKNFPSVKHEKSSHTLKVTKNLPISESDGKDRDLRRRIGTSLLRRYVGLKELKIKAIVRLDHKDGAFWGALAQNAQKLKRFLFAIDPKIVRRRAEHQPWRLGRQRRLRRRFERRPRNRLVLIGRGELATPKINVCRHEVEPLCDARDFLVQKRDIAARYARGGEMHFEKRR